MRFLFKLVYRIVLLILIAIVGIGIFFTMRTNGSEKDKIFYASSFPDPTLDGIYQGSIDKYSGFWKGISFDSESSSGHNIFRSYPTDEKKYFFNLHDKTSLRDMTKHVLAADFKRQDNPWWLRPLVFEIVQTSPGHYLGKFNFRLVPSYPFALGFFELEFKSEQQ